VVRDAASKSAIARAMAAHLEENERMRAYFEQGSVSPDPSTRLMLGGALALARGLDAAPVLVVPCLYPFNGPLSFMAGSSIFPAIQNLLLAARGLGVGTVLTGFQFAVEPILREVLALPDDAQPAAIIPMGYPDARFGPTRRRPLDEVLHWERWGNHEASAG
jgi:nitroreductase